MDVSPALTDPDLGFTAFSVLRTTYRRQNGSSVPSDQTLLASGCIHPGTLEMVQLLPEEERTEGFIAVYTDFPLSTGENDGGAVYTVPDRILWNGETWRVVRVRSWAMFGYVQALAAKVYE
jgi:hypothetical protein